MESASQWRFEQYREVNRGERRSARDVELIPSGEPYAMGLAHPRPFIERRELRVPAGFDPAPWPLVFLPYFGERKPMTTLGAYFDAQAEGGSALEALLPRDLQGLLRHDEDEERAYFSTLVEPASMQTGVMIIWRGDQWYVDEIFYRLGESQDLNAFQPLPPSDVVEGTLEDFLRWSPLVQARLNEGLGRLDHPKRRAMEAFHPDAVVLSLEQVEGTAGAPVLSLEVCGDGRYVLRRPGVPVESGRDAHRLTTLLIAASPLGRDAAWAATGSNGAPDKRTTTLALHVDGRDTRLTLEEQTPYWIRQLFQKVADAYGLAL